MAERSKAPVSGRRGRGAVSATLVDWPGMGFSDRAKLDYNADVVWKFFTAPDSPASSFVAYNEYVVFGGGHAATVAVRATKKGF
ncbi:alpha/beta-Hydrolases superfamily protein [Salvia divinorum]|uniref:Alpha/beta-Hydrolases superfamily protein n=1 Tax=Salvia divinorum TaxID=28513 RepID=A0ABD1HEG8_SALDI